MSEPRPSSEPFSPELSAHNVLAVLPDLEAAGAVVGELERAGIDGSDISVLGPRPEEERHRADTGPRDEGVARHVGRHAATGAAAGTALGGLAGFLGGLAAFAIPGIGPVIGAGVWAATVGGGIAGGAVGGVLGGVSSLSLTPEWEATLTPVKEGKAVVGVHSDDPETIRRAEGILRGHEPLRIERFGSRGTHTD